jgi:hypothetical protein
MRPPGGPSAAHAAVDAITANSKKAAISLSMCLFIPSPHFLVHLGVPQERRPDDFRIANKCGSIMEEMRKFAGSLKEGSYSSTLRYKIRQGMQ